MYFPSSTEQASQLALVVKNPPANAGDSKDMEILSWADPLQEEMATHSSILAWKIPWIKEPGRLKSTFTFTYRVKEGGGGSDFF